MIKQINLDSYISFQEKVKAKYKHLCRKFKLLRFICQDKDYDYIFLIKLMRIKIENMKSFHINSDILEKNSDYWEVIQSMDDCIILLNKIEEDDYDLYYRDWNDAQNAMSKDLEKFWYIFKNNFKKWWE